MYTESLSDLTSEMVDSSSDLEGRVIAHKNGFSLLTVGDEIAAAVQAVIQEEVGSVVELYHGSPVPLAPGMEWRDGSSFTDEFDLEFAGEDGYIVVAQVPVDRIRFYIPSSEREFVISAGQLNCTVYTVREYFGL